MRHQPDRTASSPDSDTPARQAPPAGAAADEASLPAGMRPGGRAPPRIAEIRRVGARPRRTTSGRAGNLVRKACARVAAVSVVVAVTSACGSAGHSPPAPAAAQASAGSVASAAAAATGSATSPASAPRAGTGDAASTQQLCNAISLNLSVLTKAAGSPNDPSLTEGIALIRRLRDTAPAEIKDDLQVIADFDAKLLAAARSSRSPDGVAETPQLTQALSREASWTAAHCPR